MTHDAKPPAAPAAPLEPGQYGQFLKEHGISSERLVDSCGVETIVVAAADLPPALKLLRNSSEVKLDLLITVTGVDNNDTYDSVYHLWSYEHTNELVIKVMTKRPMSLTADCPKCRVSLTFGQPLTGTKERPMTSLVSVIPDILI